jgi:hypothetical protein
MVSMLFLLGLVVGIALGVIVVAGAVVLVAVGVAWLNAFAVVLGKRIKEQRDQERRASRPPLATSYRHPQRS